MSEKKNPPEKLPIQFRSMGLVRDAVDSEKRTIQLAVSSETPVDRWFGSEILDHSPSSIRMDRMNNGAAVLLNHDSRQHVGVVEKASVGNDKILRAEVRLGSSPAASQALQDAKDGILRHVSVGYRVNRMKLDSSDEKEGDTYRAVDWEPVEVSLVAVPADPRVGIGRSQQEEFPVLFEQETKTAQAVEETREMATQENAAALANNAALVAERSRVSEIHALAGKFPKFLNTEQARKFVDDATPVDVVRKNIMDAQIADAKANETRNLNIADLGENEKKKYSLMRALQFASGMVDDCYEREVSDAISKKLEGIGVTRKAQGSFLIPLDVTFDSRKMKTFDGQRAGLATTSNAAGGFVVFTEFVSLIEFLYNRMKVMSLGATKLSGLRETVAFPNQATTGAASWVAENPGSDVTDSDITFGQITLSPKMLQASTSFSRKLLSQASIDVEGVVRAELMVRNALAIDLAAINGSGVSNQPKGILNQSGIGSVVTGGAPLINDNFVDLETKIAAANADEANMSTLTTPEVRGRLKKVPKLANTAALPIWSDGNTVNGYPAAVSNQVPKTLGGGASHAVIFGDWSQLLIGDWGVMEVIVDPYRLKKQGMIEVTTYTQMDCNVRHAQSFAAITDADPTAQ
jgi:HK97 family phage major capsid protein/HK97 family phage prohead protease